MCPLRMHVLKAAEDCYAINADGVRTLSHSQTLYEYEKH